MAKSTAVVAPNLGLYYNRPSIDLPAKALLDGYNFRIKNGVISSLNLGWELFTEFGPLNGPITFIDNFFPRGATEHLLIGTLTDIYRYEPSNDTFVFLTPQYDTGTAAASGTAVTGTGTNWDPEAKEGDFIHFGDANYTDPAGVWYEIASRSGDTSLTLTASAGTVVDGPYTIRQTFQGNRGDLWDLDVFVQDGTSGDDLWFGTNGVDDVITWNGTDATVTRHPELGFTCSTLAVFANMMIYGAIEMGDSFPTSIINSDVGLPLNAGSTGTGLSEQFRIHGGTDRLLEMVPLGDNLALYSARHLVLMQFIGDPIVFAFRTAASDKGPIAAHGVANHGDYHEFLGADAMYTFDGVGVRESNQHVGREIIRQSDPLRRNLIYAHFDEENGDLIWSVPSTLDAEAGVSDGAPETAWGEHYLEQVPQGVGTPFSKRAFPFTAAGYYERSVGLTWATAQGQWQEFNYSWNDQFFALAFPQNIVGDEDGNLYVLNETQTGNGAELPSFAHFGRVALGDGRERNLLRRVYPFMKKLNVDVYVKLYLADHASTLASSGGSYTFDTTLPEGGHFVSPFRRARFVELEFGSTTGAPWVLEGYDTDVNKGGMR